MKNSLEGITSRLNDTEEQVSEVKDSSENHWSWTEKRKKDKKDEDSLRDLWDNIKCTNICIIWVLEAEEREREKEQRTYLKT